MEFENVGGLKVAKCLRDFIDDEALPGTGVAAEAFWGGLEALIEELGPENRALLARARRVAGIDRRLAR